ncbi:MAG: hypothetical protein ACXVH0_00155 [Thermoanaerobaculia bacterium]
MTLPWVAAAAGIFLLLTGGFVLANQLIARHRSKIFLEGLGGVVRIGTSCRVVSGRALVPGTVALAPSRLCWDAPFGLSGQFTFEEIQRLETDERTQAQRGFLRSKVLRVTATSGEVKEFVLSPGHAWEWRQALGEWTGKKGAIAGAAAS